MYDFAPPSDEFADDAERAAYRAGVAQALVESGVVSLTLAEWQSLTPDCQAALAAAGRSRLCSILLALAGIAVSPQSVLPELSEVVEAEGGAEGLMSDLLDADLRAEAREFFHKLIGGRRGPVAGAPTN